MVPNITTILQRFTGECAILRQPEAILTVCREIGYTPTRRCQNLYPSWASGATALKVTRSSGAWVPFLIRVLDLVPGGHYNPSCRVWPMAQGHPIAAIAKGG